MSARKTVPSRLFLAFVVIAGCLLPKHSSGEEPVAVTLPPVLAIRGDHKLCLVVDGQDSVLYEADGILQAPSVSPDGRFVSVYEHSGLSILGIIPNPDRIRSGVKSNLILLDRYLGDTVTFGELRFRRAFGQPDDFNEFYPPLWWHDGEHMLLVSKRGLEAVHLDRTRTFLLKSDKITAFALSTDRRQLAFSDGRALYEIRDSLVEPVLLVDTVRSAEILDKGDISAMSFSADGQKLAIAHHRRISVLDLSNGDVTEWKKSSDRIYWLDWLPKDSGLVILCGDENRDLGPRGPGISQLMVRGSFEIDFTSSPDEKPRKIYSQVDYDVRLVWPRLSSDRSHLLFSSRHNMRRGLLMVLTLYAKNPVTIGEEDDYRAQLWVE